MYGHMTMCYHVWKPRRGMETTPELDTKSRHVQQGSLQGNMSSISTQDIHISYALYPYMVIRSCIIPIYGHVSMHTIHEIEKPRRGMETTPMHYTHIWSYDHALYPYMVM